MLAKNWI